MSVHVYACSIFIDPIASNKVSTGAGGEHRVVRMDDLATGGLQFLRNSSKQEQLDTNRVDKEAVQTADGGRRSKRTCSADKIRDMFY